MTQILPKTNFLGQILDALKAPDQIPVDLITASRVPRVG
jgi:hypothetical protein